MSELEERLEQILGNPQAMSQIMNMAQTLGRTAVEPNTIQSSCNGQSEGESLPIDPGTLSSLLEIMRKVSDASDEKTELLNALKPFVRESRVAKINKAIQLAKVSHVVSLTLHTIKEKGDLNV